MKKLFLLLVTAFTLSCCQNDDPPKPITELDKLPPATQAGANTIGCLLDGKAITPGHYNNSMNCFYQFVDGNYYFAIHFNNKDPKFNLSSLGIFTRKKEIHEGETYPLLEYQEGNAAGAYIYNANDPVYTSSSHSGELEITKLDSVKGIVSGTFWYDIVDYQGIKHEIREGRFDMHYTN